MYSSPSVYPFSALHELSGGRDLPVLTQPVPHLLGSAVAQGPIRAPKFHHLALPTATAQSIRTTNHKFSTLLYHLRIFP